MLDELIVLSQQNKTMILDIMELLNKLNKVWEDEL